MRHVTHVSEYDETCCTSVTVLIRIHCCSAHTHVTRERERETHTQTHAYTHTLTHKCACALLQLTLSEQEQDCLLNFKIDIFLLCHDFPRSEGRAISPILRRRGRSESRIPKESTLYPDDDIEMIIADVSSKSRQRSASPTRVKFASHHSLRRLQSED